VVSVVVFGLEFVKTEKCDNTALLGMDDYTTTVIEN
jgi:hypothetical protein